MQANVKDRASELYLGNHNCAQSVLAAYCPYTGMDEDQAMKLAASFGGGMGSLGEVCGALTGAFMVVGLMEGYTDPSSKNKQAHNAVIQGMAGKFREQFGSLLCRDLLWRNVDDESKKKEEKPCLKYVQAAVDIVNDTLKQYHS